MERETFYKHARQNPFPGKLMQSQVEGMDAILDEWDKRKLEDPRWLAYMLATAFHETAFTMQPIHEYGRKDRLIRLYDVQGSDPGRAKRYGNTTPGDGARYCGRGYVQLTWKNNYAAFTQILQVDLVNNPERALEPKIAAQIMFEGMIRGTFTGVSLSKFFKPGSLESDWFNARKIINGLDKADTIGRYARAFWYAILMAEDKPELAAAVSKSGDPAELEAEYKGLKQEFSGNDDV